MAKLPEMKLNIDVKEALKNLDKLEKKVERISNNLQKLNFSFLFKLWIFQKLAK